MKKILIASLLLCSFVVAKNIHEYSVYYPKNFTPEGCLAWHEEGGGSLYNCNVMIVCYGSKNGEHEQYTTKADACKDIKPPFVIKYKKGATDDMFYLDINEVKIK